MSCAVLAIREVATAPYHAVAHAHARPTITADPDAVDQLGDEIATLSAHIHAATHRRLVLIAEFGTDIEPGRAELEDGTGVSPETCRRLACDASIVNVAHDRSGSVRISDAEVCELRHVTMPTVGKRRSRFIQHGPDGLTDEPRPACGWWSASLLHSPKSYSVPSLAL
ncbi:hypothetical protein BH23GEM10_BH23GEM10_16300 [soil metagenome]